MVIYIGERDMLDDERIVMALDWDNEELELPIECKRTQEDE
jgi:hypothetical protein